LASLFCAVSVACERVFVLVRIGVEGFRVASVEWGVFHRRMVGHTLAVLERVDEAAEKEGRSRSNYIDQVLRIHLGLEKASKPLARSSR
jgi:hypothetical protein